MDYTSNNIAITSSETNRVLQHSPNITDISFIRPTFSTDIASTTTATEPFQRFNGERVNLESHQLIWLGADVDTLSMTVGGLRKIIDYMELFDNVDKCLHYIERTQDTKTFLVLSGKLDELFISRLNKYENILSVYLYCRNEDYDQQWASNCLKIKGVYNQLDELANDLTEDVRHYLIREEHEIFNELSRKDDTTDEFLYNSWPGFLNLLCCLPYPNNYHQKLINLLKEYYEGKEMELEILNEFEREYTPSKAIWWYTRPTFFYRLLNKTLRQHNVRLMFLFGFFIQDICRQLSDEHEKFKLAHLHNSIIKVYRGQFMSRIELERLKQTTSVVNNSMFSTSTNRSLASLFVNSSTQSIDELQNVLFEIEIDACKVSHPYANISHLSAIPDESEILFMIGTRFKKESNNIIYDENVKTWIVKLKLIYDRGADYDQLFDRIVEGRQKLKQCISGLYAEFWLPSSMEELNIIFNGLLSLYPSEKWIEAFQDYYTGRYLQTWEIEKYELALSIFEQSINKWNQYINDDELNCAHEIAQIHYRINQCYQHHLKNQPMAQKHFDLSVKYYQIAIAKSDANYEKTKILHNFSYLYETKMCSSTEQSAKLENGLMAIKYKELAMQNMSEYSPSNEPFLAYTFISLAALYRSIFEYDNALLNCEKALQIQLQELKPHAPSIIWLCSYIIEIYVRYKHNYQLALYYQRIKHKYTLKRYALTSTDNEYNIRMKKNKMTESYNELAAIGYKALNHCDKLKRNGGP